MLSAYSKSTMPVIPRAAAATQASCTHWSVNSTEAVGSWAMAWMHSSSRSSPVGWSPRPTRASPAELSQAECRSMLISRVGRSGTRASSRSLWGASGHSPSRKPWPIIGSPAGRAAACRPAASAASRAERAPDTSSRRRRPAHWTMCTCESHSPGSSVRPSRSRLWPSARGDSPAGKTALTRPDSIRTSLSGPPAPRRTRRRVSGSAVAEGVPGAAVFGPVTVFVLLTASSGCRAWRGRVRGRRAAGRIRGRRQDGGRSPRARPG